MVSAFWPPAQLSAPALFLAGLGASLHCSLMCGALQAMQLQLRGAINFKWALAIIHSGRVSGYAVLGAIAGGSGAQILKLLPAEFSGRIIQFSAAITLAAAAFMHLKGKVEKQAHANCGVQPKRLWLQKIPQTPRLFMQGLLWATVPCGILYAALILAALSGSAFTGTLLLVSFGLGTVPLLAISGGLWAKIAINTQTQTWRYAGASALLGLAIISGWSVLMHSASAAKAWCITP